MHISLWSKNTKMPVFQALDGDVKTDVLIIGGGLCGLLCAYELEQKGVNYILVEGGKIASGITKDTTAKVTVSHGLIYSKIAKQYGLDRAKMYLEINQRALDKYMELSTGISCGLETKSAFVYTLKDREKIEEEARITEKLGCKVSLAEPGELPFSTKGAIEFKGQAQFNPLEFVAGIANKLNIYENTFVLELKKNCAVTDKGTIRADKIIVTTHFPFINKHGSYFLKLYQHRSYVCAYKNCGALEGMYVDEDRKGMSFRGWGDYLLIGGGGHRTGTKSFAWRGIEEFAFKYYPKGVLEYKWATQDCMSLDGIPYIGKYSKNTSDMYVATGFNKWGMTSSMASAMILSDMVTGKTNDCAEVFSPQRSIIKPQLAVNGFEAVKNLITPTTKRCPHMGCALKWNKWEHTWDCPCHGSRFEENGKLIDNPSTGDINV